MATPVNYTEIVHSIDERLANLERMVKAIYDLEEFDTAPTPVNKPRDQMGVEEEVKTYGQKIPYNLMDGPGDVESFQQFLYECKTKHRSRLTDSELEMVDYADKGFDDVRLSNRHLTVMKRVYTKITNRPWPYTLKQGYMFKLEPYQHVWMWLE
jgi:hypothetical protein